MTPLQRAAQEAWKEAGRMREELDGVLVPLSGESMSGNRAAWDAYRAWQRAVNRAKDVQGSDANRRIPVKSAGQRQSAETRALAHGRRQSKIKEQ